MQSQAQSAPTGKKPVATKIYSLEEYFDFEYSAEGKHEYLNGQIRAMAYTSPTHGEIQTNLMDALAACLKAKASNILWCSKTPKVSTATAENQYASGTILMQINQRNLSKCWTAWFK